MKKIILLMCILFSAFISKSNNVKSINKEILIISNNDSLYLKTEKVLICIGSVDSLILGREIICSYFSSFKELIFVIEDNYIHKLEYINAMCNCYNYYYSKYEDSYKRFKDDSYVGIELFKKFNLITNEESLKSPISPDKNKLITTMFKTSGGNNMNNSADPSASYMPSFQQLYLSYSIGDSPYYKKGFLCSNLQRVIWHDTEAMKYIKKYKRIFFLRSSITLVGYSMLGYAATKELQVFKNDVLNIGILATSAFAASFTLIIPANKFKLKNINLAIKTYNTNASGL